MLPGLRDSQGRIIATTDAVPADPAFWRGVAISPASEVYIDAGSDPTLTLDIDFRNSGPLDSRITFTRASTATYLADDGLLKTAAVDVPRFEFDANGNPLGLLIEGARTNYQLNSGNFAAASWTVTGGILSAATAPDGTNSASLIQGDGTTFTSVYGQAANGAFTDSWYVKPGTETKCELWAGGGGSLAKFDLAAESYTLTGGTSAGIETLPNGWMRIWAYSPTYAGQQRLILGWNGPNLATNLYAWGAQLEDGPTASSYIPTIDTPMTRAADNASMTGTNFSDWYDQNQGTYAAQFIPARVTDIGGGAGAAIVGSTPSNLSTLGIVGNTGPWAYNGADQLLMSDIPGYAGGVIKQVCAYNASLLKATSQGRTPTEAAATQTFVGMSGILLMGRNTNVEIFGHFQRLTYWTRVLSDSEMIDFTGGMPTTHQYPTVNGGALAIEVDGIPASIQGGIAYTADRRVCAKLNAAPSANDRYIAGVRITPEGLVHFATNALPLNSAWSTGFSSGFGNGP